MNRRIPPFAVGSIHGASTVVVFVSQWKSGLHSDSLPSGGNPSLAWQDGFRAKPGSTFVQRPSGGRRVVFAGLGKKEEVDANAYRLAAAGAARWALDARCEKAHVVLPGDESAGAVMEGWMLGLDRFEAYKSAVERSVDPRAVWVGISPQKGGVLWRRAACFSDAVFSARHRINRPPSDKPPTALANEAKAMAGGRLSVRLFGKEALAKMGARALLAVGRGSDHPPVLVHMRYAPPRARRSVALVGKGITFDSGGLSLKPADGMMTMKYDMAGAATVMAVVEGVARMGASVEVHGIAALAENMPGPDAYKPGDVVRAMNGKTIEVLNTDAEGRVVLADALAYAARLKPDAMVDVATLTGAATVALGKAYAALMTDHPELEQSLREGARRAGEKMWPLPLEKSYMEHIQSKVADYKNIGNAGEAGTIIGGLFLKQFVGEVPWAHIDMASVGWNGAGSLTAPPGATGALVRTLMEFVLAQEV